jgi:signal transduction histidine kinase
VRLQFASSLAMRLTAALIAVTFLTTASLLAGIYYFSVWLPMDEVRRQISRETADLGSIYLERGSEGLVAALLRRREIATANKAFDAFIDRDGRLLTGNLPSWPSARRSQWVTIEADLYRDGDEDDHEALSRDLMLPDGRRLIVGRDVEVIADREELMGEAALWGSISVIAFGILGGLLISWITARRLDAVSRTAQSVMEGDLSVRVPIQGSGDEFDRLGFTLNAMLDRNMELMASVARVSDNIAHELRTPLARLRAALDAADGSGRIEPTQAEIARGEADRLQQIFNALLRIARLNTGRHRIDPDTIQLDLLVSDAVEYYAPEAEAKSQTLGATVVACEISGDRNLIFQATTNLLDNALKFAPEGGEVCVSLEVDRTTARLVVTDDGPGVDEDARSRLTERFFRAPGSEAKAGTGLGLALAKAIAEAHDGELSFPVTKSGFTAVLCLPLAKGS